MKKLFTRSAVAVTILLASTVSAKQLYVIGGGVFGGWNPGSPVPMTLGADGITNTMNVSLSGAEWWTICDGSDNDWDVFNSTYRYGVQAGDYDVAIGEYQLVKCNGTFKLGAGDYTISVNSETMKMTISGKKEDVVISTISIVGELTGGWDAEANVFDLTQTGNGIWTGTMTGFETSAKTYQWKVIANHRWGDFELPSSGNFEFSFPEDGKYDISFTVDVNAQTADISAEKKEDIVIEKTYTIVGSSTVIFGEEWNPALTDNDMTLQEDGTYAIEKKGVTLDAGEYEWKVAVNHAWDESYPAEGNATFTIEEGGEKDLTFTFAPANDNKMDVLVKPLTTGIHIVNADTQSAIIYNLQGQRVSATVKGLYIQNGRKYMVK